MSPAPAPAVSFPFVIARGRSGTTLLRAMLDAHPDMAVPNESHFVVQFARRRSRYEMPGGFRLDRFSRDLTEHFAFRRWGLPDREVLDAFEASPPHDCASAIRTLYATYAAHHGKSRYADKTPSYVLHVDLLASTFPESTFVHLIRDGRDVALSYLDTDFGAKTLGQAASYWDRFVRAGREAGERLGPERYRELRYEDLVRDPETALIDVCSFLGIAFDERMLRYYERADSLVPTLNHNEHHRNLYKPPTTGLRDWRRDLTPRHVEVFEVIAGNLLSELGYERAHPRPGIAASTIAVRYGVETWIRRIAHGTHVRARKLRNRVRRLAGRRSPAPEQARIPS